MTVYVVMSNDFPDCVFARKDDADSYAETKNSQDKLEYPYRRVYYKVYPFEVK